MRLSEPNRVVSEHPADFELRIVEFGCENVKFRSVCGLQT